MPELLFLFLFWTVSPKAAIGAIVGGVVLFVLGVALGGAS